MLKQPEDGDDNDDQKSVSGHSRPARFSRFGLAANNLDCLGV
jgi:hypothetical protein